MENSAEHNDSEVLPENHNGVIKSSVDYTLESFIHVKEILTELQTRGIAQLRPLQAKVIEQGLFFNVSFLVATPSGSGKTLVGELAAMNSIFELKKRAVFLVPYKALAHEKYRLFKSAYEKYGVKVKIAMGDISIPQHELEACDLLITTFEKLDSILRSESSPWKANLNTVIVDEVHVMGDWERGARLESLIVRLTRKYPSLQLICLSATIANPVAFQGWIASLLGQVILIEEYDRPVPLIYEIHVAKEKEIETRKLLRKTLDEKGQALVFLNSRKGCFTMAKRLASTVEKYLSRKDRSACRQAAEKLDVIAGGFEGLSELIRHGIGIHHAGLNLQERRAIESLYFHRHLKTICCTSTLAAGINLPARRVIMYNFEQSKRFTSEVGIGGEYQIHPTKGFSFKPVPRNRAHQILGRAGRPGLDDIGYGTILTTSPEERAWVEDYYFTLGSTSTLEPRYDPLVSSLVDKNILAEQVLIHAMDMRVARVKDIEDFLGHSFYWYCKKGASAGREGSPSIGNFTAQTTPCEALEVVPVPITSWIDQLLEMKFRNTWRGEFSKLSGVEVRAIMTSEVSFSLIFAGIRYLVKFNGEDGPFCSCKNKYFQDATGLHPLCLHLALAIHSTTTMDEGIQGAILPVIRKSLSKESVVEWLLEEGFLKDMTPVQQEMSANSPSASQFRCTKFGIVTTRGYIPPNDAIRIREVLREEAFDTIDDILHIIADEYAQRSGRKSVYPLLWKWIHEVPLPEIMKYSAYNLGDLNAIKEDVKRLAGNYDLLAKFFGMHHVSELCEVLAIRLDHGIQEDLFDIVLRLKGIGRVKGRRLVNAGFRYLSDLQGVTLSELVQRTSLSPYDCDSIQKQIEGLDNPPL